MPILTAVLRDHGMILQNPEDLFSRTIRTNDTPQPVQHGIILGQDRLAERRVILDIMLIVEPTEIQSALDFASTLFAPTDGTIDLIYKVPGSDPRVLHGRPRNYTVQTDGLWGQATLKVEFICGDPRIYALTPKTFELQETVVVGGMTFPMTFPITFTTSLDTGTDTAVVVNGGNIDAPFQLTVHPSTNATITHQGQNRFLRLTSIFTTGFVIIDSLSRTIVWYPDGFGSAGQNVYSWLSGDSQWFTIEPGNNTLSFNETSGGAGYVTGVFTDAWI